MNPYLKKQLKKPLDFLKDLHIKKSSYWKKRGEKMAFKLFKEMSERVPAYKKFLKENNINPKDIKNFKDTGRIPPVSKETYLKKYDLEDLCWDGSFNKTSWVISSTSGSSGEPFYFPRTKEQDLLYSLTAELYLITNFNIDKKSTLYIDAFPMGPWIGGLFTYQAIKYVIDRGKYNMSIITTGIDKSEIIKAVKRFGKMFDQIIIGSYGPFLKDTLEEGLNKGLNWKDYEIRFIFSAEGFSNTFRDYVLGMVGQEGNFEYTLNHYGTVDLGTMAYETPLSIKIRRLLLENKEAYKEFFKETNKLPTLCQYVPEHFYFEEIEKGGLLCSSYSGIPLFKYDLINNGGVISYNKANQYLSKYKLKLKDSHVSKKSIWKLPFVFVFERSDFSVSFYAFQIYPETIRKALQLKELEHRLTGKFTMLVDFDKIHNQKLYIHIELSKTEKYGLKLGKIVKKLITDILIENNSSYRETYKEKGEDIEPILIFYEYEDPKYFKSGIKQKWVKNKI